MVKWIIVAVVVAAVLIFVVKFAKASPTSSKLTSVISGQRTLSGQLSNKAIAAIIANPTARSGAGHF